MRGDFIGFTYNGFPSSDLGIMRVSDGSRFNENLLPTMQDKTAQVPGGDGTYYFGSFYTQKQFDIPYAFDSLTEQQLANLKRVFGDKQVHDLIFDEAPYKKYRAKVTGTAQIKYVPFGNGETIYKGEGTIQFTAYEPYARSVHKFLCDYRKFREIALNEKTYKEDFYFIKDEENDTYIKSNEEFNASQTYYEEYSNTSEWELASGMLETQGNYDKRDGNTVKLYNPGVKESDFILTLSFSETDFIPAGTIEIDGNRFLTLSQINRQGNDSHIKIDTKIGLIYGIEKVIENDIENSVRTGTIYNQYITDGDFFKIPCYSNKDGNLKITMSNTNNSGIATRFDNIDYDYYYY